MEEEQITTSIMEENPLSEPLRNTSNSNSQEDFMFVPNGRPTVSNTANTGIRRNDDTEYDLADYGIFLILLVV